MRTFMTMMAGYMLANLPQSPHAFEFGRPATPQPALAPQTDHGYSTAKKLGSTKTASIGTGDSNVIMRSDTGDDGTGQSGSFSGVKKHSGIGEDGGGHGHISTS